MAAGIVPSITNSLDTFTDFDILPNQSGTMNFGPVTGNETTQYRTWAAFTGGGPTQKAYAVTNGEVFIQELPASPTLVNLILKPDVQPDCKYGHVRYFVYRGLLKSAFLDNTGNVLADNPSVNSDLMNRMWVVRNNLNTQASTPGVTLVRGDLGLDPTGGPITPDSTLIDDVFNLFVFQRVSQGMYIGDFDTTNNYGFEIIVEGNNYQPKLGDVRILDHIITITYQAGQNQFALNQPEDISIKLMREQILSYLDPVAYFGLLSNSQIVVHNSTGNVTAKTPVDIFNQIISKFATNGNVYIDLRDELNNSLNYFGAYSDNTSPTLTATIQFKCGTNPFGNKPYTSNGWPILILNNATDFSPTDPGSIATASFMLPAGDNIYPIIYLSGSSFFADSLNYVQKFQILTLNTGYTNEFDISVANNPGVAIFPFGIKLSYTRRYDIDNLLPIPSILTRPWKDDYMDNILSPVDVNITTDPADPTFQNAVPWNTNNDMKYIGWTSIKNGSDYTLRSGLAKDSIGEVVLAFRQGPSESANNIVATVAGATSTKSQHFSIDLEKNKMQYKSFYLALQNAIKLIDIIPITLVTNTNPNLSAIQVHAKYNYYSIELPNKSFDDLFTIAYTETEKTAITSIINSFLSASNCYYIMMNHQLLTDNNDLAYFTFNLGVQGIVFNTPTQYAYEVQRIDTGVILYSGDGKNYFTESYANALLTLLNS